MSAESLLQKHPDRIPVIINYSDKIIPIKNKNRFLVPKDISFGAFVYILRKYISIRPEQSLFVFINKTLVPGTKSLEEIYSTYKSDDSFLRCTADTENTFGCL